MPKPNPKHPNPHKPTTGKFVSWDQAASTILLGKGKQTIIVPVSTATVVDVDDADGRHGVRLPPQFGGAGCADSGTHEGLTR